MKGRPYFLIRAVCGTVSRGGSVRLISGPGGGRICMPCAGQVLRPVLTDTWDDLLLEKRRVIVAEWPRTPVMRISTSCDR
jgi:hypothetical protein